MATVAIGAHLEDLRPLPAPCTRHRALAGVFHCRDVHTVDLLAGNAEHRPAAIKLFCARARAPDMGPHGVAVILDDVEDRQLPQRGHVEALIDLALIGGTLAEISKADAVVSSIFVGEGDTGAERRRRAHDAVPAVEIPLDREHVHGAAFAFGVAMAASGKLSHHALRLHAGREHMAMIAIGGDDLVSGLDRHLHADDDSLLADIEVTESSDEAHAIELASLLLEATNEQHQAIGGQFLLGREDRLAAGHRLGLAIAEPEICSSGREAWAIQVCLLRTPRP